MQILRIDPLYKITEEKKNFVWGPEQQEAFQEIKRRLTNACSDHPQWSGYVCSRHRCFLCSHLSGAPPDTEWEGI